MKNAKNAKVPSRLSSFGKVLLFVLGLTLLTLVCTQLRFILSAASFFSMMGGVSVLEDAQHTEASTYSLNEMKKIASFLLEQPERERRQLIAVYSLYAENHSASVSLTFDLFVLLRLLFDLPQTYPSDDVKYFGGWTWLEPPECRDEMCNLLWPLQCQDGQLILSAVPNGYFGIPYDGLGEYYYFSSRFSLRAVDHWECDQE
jgi:hypothetical protein